MEITPLRQKLEQEKGRREQVEKTLEGYHSRSKTLARELRQTEEAQAILQKVAQSTQEELKYFISDVVSLALDAVFENPYKLEVDFVLRRGKTEADIWFIRNGERVHPISGGGGGAVDVAAFALRVALWNLSGSHRTRNTLILDEPFKFLSTDLQPLAGEMLRMISKKLGLQIIMVSHVLDLIESADKVFKVENRKGVSSVL